MHIVTKKENYEAMKAKGDYNKAGIKLIKWNDLTLEQQKYLWRKMLYGKVANYKKYDPNNQA